MKAILPLGLALTLTLNVIGSAFAEDMLSSSSLASPLAQISQSLPPIQGGNTYPSNPYPSNSYTAPSNSGYSAPATYPNNTYTQPYNNYSAQPQGYTQQAPLQGYVVTAPPGTVVSATAGTAISSDYARVGDRFNVTLGSPITSGSSVILPAGSQMEGQVVMAKPAGRAGKNGELDIRFTSATLPNGQRLPLSARVQTEDGTGIIHGGSTAGRFGRAAVTTGMGAGLGAALGTAMGPLSGGGVGRGAIYGTVLGAGMGALGSAVQKGKPAIIDSSQPINIVLDQPLTTSPNSGMGSYNAAPSNYNNGQPDPSFQYYQPNNGGAPANNTQPYNNYYGN